MKKTKLIKVVINMGVGKIAKEKESLTNASNQLAVISGQKPAIRAARISVAGFNLRRGMPVGLIVTLRGAKALNFVTKFAKIVLPRFRDFRGVSLRSFDKSGNYSIGVVDLSVFPEIDISRSDKARGMEITIVTNAKDAKESKSFLESLGIPFEKN